MANLSCFWCKKSIQLYHGRATVRDNNGNGTPVLDIHISECLVEWCKSPKYSSWNILTYCPNEAI